MKNLQTFLRNETEVGDVFKIEFNPDQKTVKLYDQARETAPIRLDLFADQSDSYTAQIVQELIVTKAAVRITKTKTGFLFLK